MLIGDALILMVILGLIVAGAIKLAQLVNLRQISASAPPRAGVLPGDTRAEIEAKVRLADREIESVRILSAMLSQDDLVPILSEKMRADINEYLSGYYGNHHRESK